MEAKELMTKRKIEKLASEYESNKLSTDNISENDNYKVFISHSSKDNEFIRKVICFLIYAKGGIQSYVDWQDQLLQHKTNVDTAEVLKKRIKRARKIIFVVTNDSLKSVWCSWELGFADSEKGVDNIALLAIKPNNGYWKNNEYLQQYPWIWYDKSLFKVTMPNGRSMTLYEWLNN